MPKTEYDISAFIKACESGNVFIWNQALVDADKVFNLRTKEAVLEFISNNGLEVLSFECCKLFEKNPDTENPILIDSYEFMSLGIKGYIAFFFNKKTGFWNIKSFKQSKNASPTMLDAFLKIKEE